MVAHGLEGVGSRLEGSEGRLEVSTIFDRGRDGDPSVIMRISPLANSRPIAPAKSLLDMPSEWEGESVHSHIERAVPSSPGGCCGRAATPRSQRA